MKKFLGSVLLVSLLVQAKAQDSNRPVRPASIGVSFFVNDYKTAAKIRQTSLAQVFRDGSWSGLSDMEPGLAVTYFKGLHTNIDFAGTLSGSFASRPIPNKTIFAGGDLLLEADASFNFKMLPDNFIFNPYLIAGIGASRYNEYYGAFVPLGGGVKIRISNDASLFVTHQYRVPITTETTDYHFYTSLGVAGSFGREKQPEPKPLPPPPIPVDTDGDGIPDNLDKCPTVAGVAKYQGCPIPDTDKDGINDEEDKCPNEPGLARYQGCPIPDTDKDGINDEEDKCPTVAGVARYQGCPVPDTDNDGVNDEEDKCPTVPGTAANNGCPEIKQEVINRVNYAARNIFFVTGSAKLSPKSFKALDEIVSILGGDTNLKLAIEGHTDNVGKAAYNQTLSQNRANSVKDYLVKKGVDESRLTATGYGMDQPVADNKTAAGRAKNRRVELKLAY